jgi:hypothetical protein
MSPPAVYVFDVPIVPASVHPTVANVLQYRAAAIIPDVASVPVALLLTFLLTLAVLLRLTSMI